MMKPVLRLLACLLMIPALNFLNSFAFAVDQFAPSNPDGCYRIIDSGGTHGALLCIRGAMEEQVAAEAGAIVALIAAYDGPVLSCLWTSKIEFRQNETIFHFPTSGTFFDNVFDDLDTDINPNSSMFILSYPQFRPAGEFRVLLLGRLKIDLWREDPKKEIRFWEKIQKSKRCFN